MLRHFKLIAGLLILVFVATGCVPTTSHIQFADDVYGLNMQYPNTWTEDNDDPEVLLQVFSPDEGAEDTFLENINIVFVDVTDFGEEFDVDTFYELNEAGLSDGMVGYTKLDEEGQTVAGLPAKKLTYTGQIDDLDLKFAQWYLIHNNTGFVITYTGFEEGGGFDKFLPEALEMISSITFTE